MGCNFFWCCRQIFIANPNIHHDEAILYHAYTSLCTNEIHRRNLFIDNIAWKLLLYLLTVEAKRSMFPDLKPVRYELSRKKKKQTKKKLVFDQFPFSFWAASFLWNKLFKINFIWQCTYLDSVPNFYDQRPVVTTVDVSSMISGVIMICAISFLCKRDLWSHRSIGCLPVIDRNE